MEKSIVIIANAPSVLGHKLGEKIDTYQTVARINNYQIKGFENSVGTRTDIWFNGANQGLKKRKSIPESVIVFIPPEILNRKGNSIHNRIQKRLNLNGNGYTCISLDKMLEYEKMCNIARLTTGTNAICWAMEHYEDVTIHGYDFFQKAKNHYFDGKLMNIAIKSGIKKYGKKHSLKDEKEFVFSLIKQNKIKQLLDD